MKPEQLAVLCRCGHARRFHLQGTIWQAYEKTCQVTTHAGEYRDTGCLHFEPVTDLVVLKRGSHGRFAKVEQ